MKKTEQYIESCRLAGCPADQIENFNKAGILLQPRQLAASAAARLCDQPGGPTAIGYGGARGGGKSHWLLAQMGADDCQRLPGLKCLLLRKVGKSNLENFEDLRKRLFHSLKHDFNASRGLLTFENGSRIIAGHYQCEKDIDSYLGLEYDVIGIEEATTLTARKYQDITTCCRTSKPNWRPRIYSTTNPGGVGHEWYRETYIVPHQCGTESATRFIPARVDDNKFTNPEYKAVLASRTGWQKDAWFHGKWDIAAGQFFSTFRREVHVIDEFDDSRAHEWIAAMDYGFTHYTVVLLGCRDADDNIYIVDEHAERQWVPQRHCEAIKEMLRRHRLVVGSPASQIIGEGTKIRMRFDPPYSWRVHTLFAGGDVYSRQCDGTTIASHYSSLGVTLRQANTNRVQGWAEILQRLGDPDAGVKPTLFIHKRCTRLLESLPYLQHDPDHPADVLKANTNEEGIGGDDAADALRYLVASKVPRCYVAKLRGL
ncbi:MAG: terminase large subunit domain-containing protein [Limisphaerales bacterium]